MSRYDDDDTARGWKVAFSIVLVALVACLVWAITATSQKSSMQSKYQSELSQYTSANAQGQQQCIASAQQSYDASGGITPTAASDLSAQVSACQSQYPTH